MSASAHPCDRPRNARATENRFPDLTALQPEHPEQLQAAGPSALRLGMTPPMLVVEVVSPGPDNHRRDYIDERNQYEWRGMPEYWIVDPVLEQVTVLVLTDQGYGETVFVGDEPMRSPTFPSMTLTPGEILNPA
ncbi:MAG: Uma2 family endonuclease [Cyanobacteria bacterium J06659_2]